MYIIILLRKHMQIVSANDAHQTFTFWRLGNWYWPARRSYYYQTCNQHDRGKSATYTMVALPLITHVWTLWSGIRNYVWATVLRVLSNIIYFMIPLQTRVWGGGLPPPLHKNIKCPKFRYFH